MPNDSFDTAEPAGGASRRRLLTRTITGAAGLTGLATVAAATPASATTTGAGVPDWVDATAAPFNADPTGSADSTTAIQSALDSLSGKGGVVYLPSGTYVCNQKKLTAVDGVTLQGATAKATVIHFDGAVNHTLFGADTGRPTFSIRDLSIVQTNAAAAGTAIDASSFVYSDFTRLVITGLTIATGPTIGIDFNGGSAYYNWVDECQITVAGANAIGIRFDNGSNNNHVLGGRVDTTRCTDANATGYYVNAKSNSLRSPNCQDGPGVGIDVGLHGVATTITDPYLENNAVANLRLAAGVLSPTVIGGTIENDNQFVPNITDNGAISPIILNARTSHGGDIYAHTKAVIGSVWQPEDQGLISWAYDPAAISGSCQLTPGTAYFVKLPIRYVTTITRLWFHIATAPAAAAAGRNFFGLYIVDPGSTTASLVASGSADTAVATAGVNAVTLTTPRVVTPGSVYACVMASGFTGTLALGGNTVGATGNVNIPTASGWRFFQNTSGNTTSLPSAVSLPASAAAPGNIWAAVS